MSEIKYAEINGVQLRDLVELDAEEEALYKGDIYVNDVKIGNIEEDPKGGPMAIYISEDSSEDLERRIKAYFDSMELDGMEEDESHAFFLDLIDMEVFFEIYSEDRQDGYGCLVVDASGDEVALYNVADENDVEALIREKNLVDFEVYSQPEDFVICVE